MLLLTVTIKVKLFHNELFSENLITTAVQKQVVFLLALCYI